jgi:hypothetical protein
MTLASGPSRSRLSSERGFTLAEMMIAAGIMIAVTGAVFSLLNPAQGTFQAQPQVADMQQRLRVAVDSLGKDLVMAGAGSYMGQSSGALSNYFAAVMPFDPDNDAPGTFRPDAISVMYVPPTPAQTTIRDGMPKTSQQLKVHAQANCPPNKHDALCGFTANMRVIIFDDTGAWDAMNITTVQDEALHLGHDGELSKSYDDGARITQVATHTYYLKTDTSAGTFELRHFDGMADLPLVDDVVGLEFEYFGEPQPARLLPNKALTDTVGPWTTYGPKPPALGVNNASDNWPAGENCAFFVDGGQHVPRMQVLDTLGNGVGQVPLTAAMFTDGPWCADDTHPNRYDADLLRIRRIRVTLRVQVANAALRGADPGGVLFKYPGSAVEGNRLVPDQEISFDVTPRNLNLGR